MLVSSATRIGRPETAAEGSSGKRSPYVAERESSRIGMRDPCNGNHARSRSPVPELSSDIIAERRDVLAQGSRILREKYANLRRMPSKKRPTGGDSAKGGIRGQRTAAKEETVVQDFQVEERVSCTLPAEPHCR